MAYTDCSTAGDFPGSDQINITHPALPGIGQENSAYGTGPEKSCSRTGGRHGGTLRRYVSQCPYGYFAQAS